MARSAKRKDREQSRKLAKRVVNARLKVAANDDARDRLDAPRQWANHNPHNAEGMTQDIAALRLGYRRADATYLEYRETRNAKNRKVEQRGVRSKKSGLVWNDAKRGY